MFTGCPENVHFVQSTNVGAKVRWRNIDNIIEEIADGIKNYKIGEIQFEDDTLLLTKIIRTLF